MNIINIREPVQTREGTLLSELVAALDTELGTSLVADYPGALNGLQFANDGQVHHVAVAVDASRQSIAEAESRGADLLVVHHGLFWSGVQPVSGIVYDKFRALIRANIAVYSSHLPLDLHATLGNNVRLADALGLRVTGGFARYKTVEIGVQGEADESTSTILRRIENFSAQYGGTVRTSVPAA